MADLQLSININLAGLAGHAQRVAQRAMNLVAIGINACRAPEDLDLQLPDVSFHHTFDPEGNWTPEKALEEWRPWVLMNGFRDIAEAVAALLEQARTVLAYWDLVRRLEEGGSLTVGDLNDVVTRRGKKFHRLGLPDKLEYLERTYALTIDAGLTNQVSSINAVRNCLVHRGGIVTERDATENGKLVVRWTALALVLEKDGVQREAIPPVDVEAGTQIGIGNRPRSKEFALGQPIAFDVTEFAQICWTTVLFAMSCGETLERYGRARGIRFSNQGAA